VDINYKPTEIWDYSEANIKILKEKNIHAIHVPLKTPMNYMNKLLNWRNIQYDIGFCGCDGTRRNIILYDLKNLGKTVHIITTYGDERDAELAKCKILLNIHYDEDFKIFESARCEPWLAIGVPIISENSLDNDPRCYNVPYDKIVEKTIEVLNTL
jgi:hypothetical protein